MSLRIISGERRGAHIEAPPGMETRPLRDRIRQALFNTLRPLIRESVVLDAFAGSGAVGLEALSNGATKAVFVDQSREASHQVRRNVQKLRYEDRSTILEGPCPGVLKSLPASHPRFDLVFLMPPYHSGLCAAVMENLEFLARVEQSATIVCEIHVDEPDAETPSWVATSEKKYGITRLLFFERK